MEQIPVTPLSRKLVGVLGTPSHLNTAPPRFEEKKTPGWKNLFGDHRTENPNGSQSLRKHCHSQKLQLLLSQNNSRRRSAFASSVIPEEEEEDSQVFQVGNHAEVAMDNLKDQMRENRALKCTISELQQQKEEIEDQFQQDKEQYSQEMQKATQIQDDDDLKEYEFTSENADKFVHTVRDLVSDYRQLASENRKLQDTSAELMRQQSELGKISEEYRKNLEVCNQKLQEKEEEYLKLVEDIQTQQSQVVQELQKQVEDGNQQLQQKEEYYKQQEEEKQKLYQDKERGLLQQLEERNQEIQQLQQQRDEQRIVVNINQLENTEQMRFYSISSNLQGPEEQAEEGFENFEEEVIQMQETPDSNQRQATDDQICRQAEVEQFQPRVLGQDNGAETPVQQQQLVQVEVNSQIPQTPQNSSATKSSQKRKSGHSSDGVPETKRRKYNLRKYTVDVVDKQNLTPIQEEGQRIQEGQQREGVGHEMLQSHLHHSRELKRIVSSAEERQDLLQMARQELEEGEIPDIIPQLDEQQRTPTVATTQSGGRKGRGRPSGSRRTVKSDGAVNQDVSSRPRRSNTRSKQKSKK